MDHGDIARAIMDEIHAADGIVSVIYKDFDTGSVPFQFAPDYVVPSGDMAKIAILLAALSRVQNGDVTLDKCVIVPNLWINYDTVAFERGQMSYSIDELLSWMIVANEDTAANVLIEILGLNYINECCTRFGLVNTRVECRLGQTKVEDNLRTFREEWPLTPQERTVLLEIAENLKKGVPCTACRYCCDGCPVGLDILYLLQCYNDFKFAQSLPPSMRIDALGEEKRPAACIGCGQCMHACPQGIEVPAALAELTEMYEKGPHWSEQVKIRQKFIQEDLGEK